jgi:hypothetical protein
MKLSPILTVALLIVFTIGCDDTAFAPHPDPGPSIPPKVGSTFTYREFAIDSNGREVAGTSTTVTAVVVSSDTTLGELGGLTLIQEDSVRYYVQYDTSGDVVVRSNTGGFLGGTIQTWPFGSQTSANDVSTDALGGTDSVRTFVLTSYSEAAFTTTPAGRFNTHRVSSFVLMRSYPDNTLLDSTLDIVRWYSPALGVEVKHTVDVDASSGPYDRRIRELVGYVLR